MAKNYTYDMTRGNPTKLLLQFALPMLVGNLFQQFYNMVDAMIVGKYVGPGALAAVGATGSINYLFFSLSFGLAAGIGIIVSQFFGAQDEEKVKKTIATSIYVMTISALVMGLIGVLAARPIMGLLDTPADIMNEAVLYMQVTCAGLIAVAGYNGISSILRALGDSMTPLLFLGVASIINIGLDLLFVITFGMGVLGVALATIIAQAVAAIGCVWFALKKVPFFHMPLKDYLRPDPVIVKKCLYLGIPVALQNAMISVSCIVLQKVVNGFGTTIVAAFTAETRFEQLVHQPFNSLGAAIATFTGQNIGAGKNERVRQGFWAGTCISVIFSVAMLPVAWYFGEDIMRFFTNDANVIMEGAKGIRITSLFYVALGMIYVTRNVLNGAGDVNFAMFSGGIEVVGRAGFARPLTMIPAIGMMSIWYTTGLTWFITALVSCVRYGQGKWRQKGIVENHEEKNALEA